MDCDDKQPALAEITVLLQEWGKGEDHALNQILPMVYSELHAQARRIFSDEGGENLLQATALVNEAYLRLAQGSKIHFESRAHFFALASRMMRRILVEQARKRHAQKRGSGLLVSLDDRETGLAKSSMDAETVLSLDKALSSLEKTSPRTARVLELKIFGEMEIREIAEILELSPATIKREWRRAKQQLFLVLSRKQ